MKNKFAALATLALLSACATTPPAETAIVAPPAIVAAPAQTFAPLTFNDQFLGAPPPADSAGQRWDADQERAAGNVGADRIAQASADQGINQRPDPFQAFQPVLGAEFTAERFPATNALLWGIVAQRIGATTQTAKLLYRRDRPFVSDPSYLRCQPALTDTTRAALGVNLSYPSGHAALGYAWALVLTELLPDRAQGLMERGYQYGQSRVICGVHWTTDVNAGRVLAAGVVAQAHGMTQFQQQMDAARAELRAAGLAP